MALSLHPSHRNPNDLQPEVCDLCGTRVGHQHLIDADVEGLRGLKICDAHPFERRARVTPSWNDLRRDTPPLPIPDIAREEPIGGETWHESAPEHQLTFDGINDRAAATVAMPTYSMSIEATMKVTTTSAAARWIAGWRRAGGFDHERRSLNWRSTGTNILGFVVGNDAGTVFSAEVTAPADVEFDVTGVLDTAAGAVRLYLDGAIAATTPLSGVFSAGAFMPINFSAGAEPVVGGSWFPGTISRIRVWSAALTAAQVAAYRGIALLGSETNLIACWELRDGLASSRNSVAGGPDLAITGATWGAL